jgi:hypothetical protein
MSASAKRAVQDWPRPVVWNPDAEDRGAHLLEALPEALRTRYSRTAAALVAQRGVPHPPILLRALVREAEGARVAHELKPDAKARTAERAARNDLASMRSAARRLAGALRRHTDTTGLAAAAALATLEGAISRDPAADLAAVLEAFARAPLADPLASARPHRAIAAGLLLPGGAMRAGSLPSVAQGLTFGAVLLARLETAQPRGRFTQGLPMPRAGRPLYPVASALLVDALGDSIDAKAAEDRVRLLLRRHPSLGFWGFPVPD